MIPKKFSKYTIKEFRKDFNSDTVCLKFIFKQFYGHLPDFDKYYQITGRKEFVHSITGQHISPLANTIFHKSSTPLTTWFEIIYKFANSRNGVSAMEIMRDFGMTYKCAWRIAKQVRTLFDDNSASVGGTGSKVEIDEMYVGGIEGNKHSSKRTGNKATQGKTAVLGAIERKTETTKSKVITRVVDDTTNSSVAPFIRGKVELGSTVYTDEYKGYKNLKYQGYEHATINHSQGEYVSGDVSTNGIESFWSLVKNGIRGTYKMVSPKYLQQYVNEFAFRYNHNHSSVHLFKSLMVCRLRNDLRC